MSVRKHLTVVLLAILSASTLALSADAGPKGPAAYIANFKKGEKVLWLGEVVAAKAYRNSDNETVIEWLARYYEIAEKIDLNKLLATDKAQEKKPPIRVRDTGEQYFAALIRSKEIALDTALEAAAQTKKMKHFALFAAETFYVCECEGKPAVFIGNTRGTVTPYISVKHVK